MGLTVAPDVYAAGVDWWNERFVDVRDDRVGFSTAFLPALLASCRLEMPPGEALSVDELRVVAKYCVADSAWQHDTISLTDFIYFLARFGPLEASLQRLVESLTVHRELVTWFHGTITRIEAERVLVAPTSPSSPPEDGAFLVRFSESQPTRFTLAYLKVHVSGPHVGRREIRNVLIENIGQPGFVLSDSKTKAYPSLRAFIQRSASRLKHGIASPLARRCNDELAAVRARQDLASNSYTTFSTDSLDPSSSSAPSSPSLRAQRPPSSLLFSKSPPVGPGFVLKYGNNQQEHLDDESENYSGFTASSLLAPPLALKSTASVSNGHATGSNGYGSFSAAAVVTVERTPPGSPARPARRQIPTITPPAGADYGDFSAFTAAVTSFSRVTSLPPPAAQQGATTTNDEYASFQSLLPHRAQANDDSPVIHASSPPNDTYGVFESFDLASAPPSSAHAPAFASQALPPPPPAAMAPNGGDDYGSFAALAGGLSLDDSPARPLSNRVPLPVASHPLDDYGAFSFSPMPTKKAAAAVQQPPPPVSHPADVYGSFDSFTSASEPAAPPASAPPDFAPASNQDERENDKDEETETKVSALGELNAGMEFYKRKLLDDALLRFIRAREVAQRAGDSVVEARALGNLGTVYLDKLKPQQAVQCYRQCLEITRSIQDVKRERTILNNLVLALMAAEDFDSAYNYCQIQLETTLSEVNRRKILSRMSLLRERAARASREARLLMNGAARATAAVPPSSTGHE